MNRIKDIKSVADFKELVLLHKESIKKAALPVTVAAALLFFWIGGDNDNTVEGTDRPVSEIMSEVEDDSELMEEYIEPITDIYVDICGAIYNPGVYKVKAGTRLFEVIDKAGGLLDDADISSINQAEEVYDGQKIIITSISYAGDNATFFNEQTKDGKININVADITKLQEIPGIGPVTAQKIIEYRENNGKFKTIDEIKKVNGIGEKTYENIKDYITV